MNQKNNALIGIFILILLIIGIIMPFIFFNSHEAEALNIVNNTTLYFEVKGAKVIDEYIPIPKPQENENTDTQEVKDDEIVVKDSDEIELESIDVVDEKEDIEKLLEEYKDEIESEDLDEGLALMDKVDLDYLLSFDRENLTTDQKQEIKDYLRSRLSESEYNKLIELIGKYIGLVQ